MAKKLRKSTPSAPAAPSKQPTARASGGERFSGPMDPSLLERLVKMMSENDLSSLEVREGSARISLQRGPQHVAYAPQAAPAYVAPAAQQPAAASQPSAASAKPQAAAPAVDDDAGLKPIKSPMVGTFYASPSPDAKPFVQVGAVVNEESDVCIIEAMKVFNNIKAEVRGTIAKICVESGKSVEFGTVLFLVKP